MGQTEEQGLISIAKNPQTKVRKRTDAISKIADLGVLNQLKYEMNDTIRQAALDRLMTLQLGLEV